MRTKFFTTLAAAALLTVGSTVAALAEAPDVQASANGSGTAFTAGTNPSRNIPAYDGFTSGSSTSNVGPSAHYHPHGIRQQ